MYTIFSVSNFYLVRINEIRPNNIDLAMATFKNNTMYIIIRISSCYMEMSGQYEKWREYYWDGLLDRILQCNRQGERWKLEEGWVIFDFIQVGF